MTNFRDDFTSDEAREQGVSGELIPDKDGYLRAVFTETTRDALRKAFKQSIDATIRDYEAINTKRDANLRAYEATVTRGEAIILPIVKRDVNQQLAWHLDAIFSKEPPFTVTALDNDPIQILVDNGNGAEIVVMSGDEYAKQAQEMLNYYLLHRIGFKRTARSWIMSMLQDGNRPPILKVIYEQKEREQGGLGVYVQDGVVERIEKDPVFRTVTDGEPSRIEGVPGDKFFVPLPWPDIQRAPFVFQEFEEDVVTIKDKIARGIYDFCRDKPDMNDVDLVVSGCKSIVDVEKWRADGRVPVDPTRSDVKLYELWFDYPFAEYEMVATESDEHELQADGTEEMFEMDNGMMGQMGDIMGPMMPPVSEPVMKRRVTTRMVPFCAVVHATSGIWLNCYENYRWDRKRPFFAGRQQDRPYSFSGYCTAENVAPFQTLITQLFNAQLQNIAVSNVSTFGMREGSPTARFFKAGAKLRPGLIWPFGEPDDVKSVPLGVPVGSMANEIGFLNSESEKMSVVTQYDRGAIPNRTPVGTVNAVDEQAKMQPRMALDNIRDTIAEACECFIRTLAQFNPGGVRVPFRDPITKDNIEIKNIGFPVEWREGQFSFNITATGDEETAQALTMRDLMLGDKLTAFGGEAMRTASAAFQPDTPPPISTFAMNLMKGRRNMLARVIRHNKLNPDDYIPSQSEYEQIPLQLEQLKQAAEEKARQDAEAAAQGGESGGQGTGQLSAATAGGNLSAPASGPQPVPSMAGQPDDRGAGGGVAA